MAPSGFPGKPGRQPDCANRQCRLASPNRTDGVSGLRLGSDGNVHTCSWLTASAFTGHDRSWPLRTGPALRRAVRGCVLFIACCSVSFPEVLCRAETWHTGVLTQGSHAKRLHPVPLGCGFAVSPVFSLVPARRLSAYGDGTRRNIT